MYLIPIILSIQYVIELKLTFSMAQVRCIEGMEV
jgi:hypothetical protein